MIAAVPEALAVSLQSGWPTPIADLVWRDKTMGDVVILGVTAPYQIVQDYVFASGRPIVSPRPIITTSPQAPVSARPHTVRDLATTW